MKKFIKALGVVMITAACTLLICLVANLPVPAAYVQAAVTLTSEGTCGDTATYTYADGVLAISGTGSIKNNAFKDATQITKVVIQNGITVISQSAFEGCSALSEITIPDSVTEIEGLVFAYSGLTSLTLPPVLTKLDAAILWDNTGVKEVMIPGTVVTMCEYFEDVGYLGAFYRSAVETLTFQNGIKTVPAMACHGMKKVKTVVIPVSVTKFEKDVFKEIGSGIVVHAYTDSYAMSYAQKFIGVITVLLPSMMPAWKLLPKTLSVQPKSPLL